MFTLTVSPKIKSTKAKVVLVAVVCVLLLFVVFVGISAVSYAPPKSISVDGYKDYSTVAKTEEDTKAFVEQFSYEAGELYSLQEMYVPIEFNETYREYNEVQKEQGLDLEPYKGEKCKLYIYEIKDYTIKDEQAYMSVLVYKDRVIGGHISAMIENGEIYTFFGD